MLLLPDSTEQSKLVLQTRHFTGSMSYIIFVIITDTITLRAAITNHHHHRHGIIIFMADIACGWAAAVIILCWDQPWILAGALMKKKKELKTAQKCRRSKKIKYGLINKWQFLLAIGENRFGHLSPLPRPHPFTFPIRKEKWRRWLSFFISP